MPLLPLGWICCLLALSGIVKSSTIPASSVNLNTYTDSSNEKEDVLAYLQREQVTVSMVQSALLQKLQSHKIPIGQSPGSLRVSEADPDDIRNRVITSTADNYIECRVTLDRAAVGSKCVAPCACTGSQKWVQFSVLNKLRRKDPRAWVTCPTCRTPYRYDLILAHTGVKANLVSLALDRILYLRLSAFAVLTTTGLALGLHNLLLRFLVSRTFWSQYLNWSKLTHLPFAIKLWLGKLAWVAAVEQYLALEKSLFVDSLADLETRLIEETLPSPNDPVLEKQGAAAEDGDDEQSEAEIVDDEVDADDEGSDEVGYSEGDGAEEQQQQEVEADEEDGIEYEDYDEEDVESED